jgi:plastocyanin
MLRTVLTFIASCSVALASVSCAGEGDGDSPAPDAGAAAHSDGTLPPEPEQFNGCSADDYEDFSADSAVRVIAIAAMGLTYTPKCTIISPGQSVRWEGSLAAHPLAPGNPQDSAAGSDDNPIEPTSSGREVEFSFPNAGTFPYYCTLHAFGAGEGMAGAIWVRKTQGTTSKTSSSRN